MFKVSVSTQAKKELKKLKQSNKKFILIALIELKEDPYIGKPLTRELTKQYSIRVGLFRVVYKINNQDKTVVVTRIGHRSIIYKAKKNK